MIDVLPALPADGGFEAQPYAMAAGQTQRSALALDRRPGFSHRQKQKCPLSIRWFRWKILYTVPGAELIAYAR